MDDLTSKINEIMSDPEKLKEIQNLGKMMGLNTDEVSNSSGTNNQNVFPLNMFSNILSLLATPNPVTNVTKRPIHIHKNDLLINLLSSIFHSSFSKH